MNDNNKKKITVLFSEGGGGHRSVAQSIKESLEHSYEVELIIPIKTFLTNLDPIKTITRGRLSAEGLYNFFLKKRLFWIVRLYGYFGEFISSLKKRGIIKRTEKFLKESKTDFLISNFPYLNNSFLAAAESLNIPFMIIVCDLYAKHYLYGIKNPAYPKFYTTLFFDHVLPKSSLTGQNIPMDHVLFMGLPIRLDFSKPKNKIEILSKLNIPTDKPIIFILMGYFGSQSGVEYFKMIQEKIKTPVHIVIILGMDPRIHKAFNEIKDRTPSYITYTKIEFSHNVSDLFFIADIVISKSGGLSISETIFMKKPIIVDWSKKPLYWEKMAGDFIEDMQIGHNANSYEEGVDIVNQWLNSPEQLNVIQEKYKSIPNIHFSQFLSESIKNIIQKFPS